MTEYSSKVFQNMVKYLGDQGKSLTVPEPGDKFDLGSAKVEILGPVKEYDDTNDTSIVPGQAADVVLVGVAGHHVVQVLGPVAL
mgnify:CR=1 FL=1